MILTIDSDLKIAYVNDWDQDSWDAQKSSIPWDYKIEFDQPIDIGALENIRDGRDILYDRRITYVTEWIGNAMIVRQETIFVQQLLPLPADPSILQK